MSALTPCNYCTLKRIRERAEREGKAVTLMAKPLAPGGVGGTAVFVGDKQVAWMMLIGDRCGC